MLVEEGVVRKMCSDGVRFGGTEDEVRNTSTNMSYEEWEAQMQLELWEAQKRAEVLVGAVLADYDEGATDSHFMWLARRGTELLLREAEVREREVAMNGSQKKYRKQGAK